MLRKSLILGSITLLMVMLFAFTGCEGPVGPAGPAGEQGNDGDPGKNGSDGLPAGYFISEVNVSDDDLIDAFARGNLVTLGTGVKTVYGEVPEKGTLVVLGDDTKVAPGLTLAVNGGTLKISDGAMLEAYDVSDAGALTASGSATISGVGGAIVLPYVLDGEFTAGLLHFKSGELLTPNSPSRYPGSVFNGETTVKLAASHLEAIFTQEGNSLTVYNITGLQANGTESVPNAVDHIPPSKTLTVKGPGNSLAGDRFDLRNSASLIVAKGAALTADSTAITVYQASTIINEGTIDLGENGSASMTGDGAHFYNDGVILSTSSTNTIIDKLIGLWGTNERGGIGTIKIEPANPVTLSWTPLRQNLVIGGGQMVSLSNNASAPGAPFNGVQGNCLITIGEGSVLSLPAQNRYTGARISNYGRLVTSTTQIGVLEYLWYEMDNKGHIEATGELAANATAGNGGLVKDLVIPEDIILTLSNNGTQLRSDSGALDAPFDVIVNGTLNLAAGVPVALIPDKGVIVNGRLQLNAGSLSPGGKVDINGWLDTGGGNGLTVASGSYLTIAATSTIAGQTGPIKVSSPEYLTINGIEGYTTPASGVEGQNFVMALESIHTAAGSLTSDITLPAGSPFNATTEDIQVIGTVEVGNGSDPYPVSQTANAVTNVGLFITVPVGTTIYGADNFAQSIQVVTSGTPSYTDANKFSIGIDEASLKAKDEGFVNNASYAFGVVLFNTVRFSNSNLVGPVVPPFMVGIKSMR
jgi:hypothetical protein